MKEDRNLEQNRELWQQLFKQPRVLKQEVGPRRSNGGPSAGWMMVLRQGNYIHALYLSAYRKHVVNA